MPPITTALFGLWIAIFAVGLGLLFAGKEVAGFALIGSGLIGIVFSVLRSLNGRGDPQIFLNCEMAALPIPFPPTSTMRALEVRSQPSSEFSTCTTSVADQATEWPLKGDSIHTAYRCELINHGDAPRYALQMSFIVVLKEAIPAGHGCASGATILSYKHQITVPILEPHVPFVFYVHNRSPHFADVRGPISASCARSKGTRRLEFKLKQSSPAGPKWMGLPPV
jgi:hypothetical protein